MPAPNIYVAAEFVCGALAFAIILSVDLWRDRQNKNKRLDDWRRKRDGRR